MTQLNFALQSLSAEELFWFPMHGQQIESLLLIYSAKLSVLEGVLPSLHKVSSLPESRFPHYGPAAHKCTESAGCSGKKNINLQY